MPFDLTTATPVADSPVSSTGFDLSTATPVIQAAPAQTIGIGQKILRGMIDPVDAAAQMFEHAMPDSFNTANHALNNWIADKTGLLAKVPTSGLDGLIQQQEQEYQRQRAASGQSGFDTYRTLGNVVSPANLAIAAKLPVATSLAGRIGYGILGGGTSASLTPVSGDSGDGFWTDKAKQAGIGAAFGGATPVVTGALSRVISPNASTNADVTLLKNEGVGPTIGQTLGGWANSLEEKAQSIPFVGDAITSARNAAKSQFNTAAINRATSPIGVSADGVGTDAIAKAGNAISSAYNQGKSMLGNFPIDPQGAQELLTLRQMAAQLPVKEQSQFNNAWSTLQGEISPNGHILPDSFKLLDSKLGSDAAKFTGSTDVYQQKLGSSLQEMQRIITENAKRANPAAAELLNKADTGYANLVRVEGAATAAKGANGIFTPGQLLNAVRSADTSVRDRATARGTALMQDLATAGQNVLGNKIPDSGTAGRLMGMGTGAAALANPILTGSALAAGTVGYTAPVQGALRALFSSRPYLAQPIADTLRKTSPLLVPSSAQVGSGLLNN